MPITSGPRRAMFRRAFAISAVVLATGGLVLIKTPADGRTALRGAGFGLVADGKNAVAFRGEGARGTLSLSHTSVLSGASTPVYAELKLVADSPSGIHVRAPLALAVVLDTSGSMQGEKINDAKRSVQRLLDDMQDDDQIAFVRYSSAAEVVQPLARVRDVRASLASRIREIHADGGTNIPSGLQEGLRALNDADGKRVRRIVLVSDGLDSTKAQAEAIARSSFASGMTVSSLGIGLDFDESYMGGVSQSGHGNFAFVRDGSSIATFLKSELHETATTTVDNARVAIAIPPGMRFVSATGADATVENGSIELRLGSIFAGDERRVLIELASDGTNAGELRARATWNVIGGESASVAVPGLRLALTNDADDVARGRDNGVLASATSVTASKRQLEAASAYAKGDVALATTLTEQNEAELKRAMVAAPAMEPALSAQASSYSSQRKTFGAVKPSSAEGRAASKSAIGSDFDNLSRPSKKF